MTPQNRPHPGDLNNTSERQRDNGPADHLGGASSCHNNIITTNDAIVLIRAPVNAATPKRLEPMPGDLSPECRRRVGVVGHGEVDEVPLHHAA